MALRIHVLGDAGSGKTTLVHALTEVMNRYDANGITARAAIKRTVPELIIEGLASIPWVMRSIRQGRRLHRASGKSFRDRFPLARWVRLVLEEYVRSWVGGKRRIIIVDQGLIFWLKKIKNPEPGLLKELPLPECVVYLRLRKSTRVIRQLERGKPAAPRKMLVGEERQHRLYQRARDLVDDGFEFQDVCDWLSEWNQMRCVPPLTDTDVIAEVERARANNEVWFGQGEEAAPRHGSRKHEVLRRACLERGVHWIDVDNDCGVAVSELAVELAEEISRCFSQGA